MRLRAPCSWQAVARLRSAAPAARAYSTSRYRVSSLQADARQVRKQHFAVPAATLETDGYHFTQHKVSTAPVVLEVTTADHVPGKVGHGVPAA